MKTRLSLCGQRFGRLTVLAFDSLDARRNSRWRCVCDCGKETVATGSNLKRRYVQSCGCLVHSRVADTVESHPDFHVFIGMLARCHNPASRGYRNYGGRGIYVCDRWREGGFRVFIQDMGQRPEAGYSIERIDNNKGYSPENCRWATSKEQGRNRRSNRHITHDGQTRTLAEWAEVLGINPRTLRGRLYKGMTEAEALSVKSLANTTPSEETTRIRADRASGMGISALARKYRRSPTTIYRVLG